MENDKITTKYLWTDVIINVIVVPFFFFGETCNCCTSTQHKK